MSLPPVPACLVGKNWAFLSEEGMRRFRENCKNPPPPEVYEYVASASIEDLLKDLVGEEGL